MSPTGSHFYFPSPSRTNFMSAASPSTSAFSSPRHSFRQPSTRRRLNSHGSYAQESEDEDDEVMQQQQHDEWLEHYSQREQLDEFTGRLPPAKKQKRTPAAANRSEESSNQKPKEQNKKNHNSNSKITKFVISALQYVIDTLR